MQLISFEQFLMEDGSPIYLQIIQYVKRGIVAGTVTDGEELPSRRMLSALLGVNPNTVQKAYKLLEEEGLIHSHSGAKSCVAVTEETVTKVRAELLAEETRRIILAMKQMGVTKEEALGLVEQFWN